MCQAVRSIGSGTVSCRAGWRKGAFCLERAVVKWGLAPELVILEEKNNGCCGGNRLVAALAQRIGDSGGKKTMDVVVATVLLRQLHQELTGFKVGLTRVA
ncbi:hypothetical protein CEXT_22641 [Caerostris extrusa]|uniref:Uncharacterized protein n=1 Tax=Caerostris extrusa TaxID=172846 RepID=A0AAV4MI69_CAEEX|nr:hypothetical protein CEXT_22641 [Caerostris extrusa]